jgi:hypothetical protein
MGDEFFYRDEGGEKRDEALHADLLTPEAEERARELSVQRLMRQGMTREEAKRTLSYE